MLVYIGFSSFALIEKINKDLQVINAAFYLVVIGSPGF